MEGGGRWEQGAEAVIPEIIEDGSRRAKAESSARPVAGPGPIVGPGNIAGSRPYCQKPL